MKSLRKKILVFASVVAVLWFVMAPVAGAVDRQINVEDDFLNQILKEGVLMSIELVSGKDLFGRLKRFDHFVVVIEIESKELLVYKHAIATIKMAP
jgi:host factor-I protein